MRPSSWGLVCLLLQQARGACPDGFVDYPYDIELSTYTGHDSSVETIASCASFCTGSCVAFEVNPDAWWPYKFCYTFEGTLPATGDAGSASWTRCQAASSPSPPPPPLPPVGTPVSFASPSPPQLGASPPSASTCTTNADCQTGEICQIQTTGGRRLFGGPSQAGQCVSGARRRQRQLVQRHNARALENQVQNPDGRWVDQPTRIEWRKSPDGRVLKWVFRDR